VRYVDGHFVESYYPTIENTFSKEIRYKGQEYATEIVDTAGQDEYSILNSKHFIGIHGYMLVYSVSSLQSFEMVQVIRDKILNHLVRPLPNPTVVAFKTNPNITTLYRAQPPSRSAS
jgi:Ras family protein